MRLKQLQILGFKSFPNKTTVKFTKGMTAIVGPNGCGKTNILDALRWVLGEQKPTLLRGGKMEEVIFNGTSELKPLGMSEVTLSIVNDRGILPTEYSEVQITRRLYRSGESEYLLNKVPCRLKDITDLFIDTGMGAHSYSVIQQDMIESIISDKAEERRFLFEEAAGITKYKHRKRAALRKLEATEQDILRLNDIYSEVKSRVNSLNRQHKKAERYSSLRDLIRGWELYTNASRVKTLTQEKRELGGRRDELANLRMSKQTAMEKDAAKLESGRGELLDLERSLTEIGKEMFATSDKAHALEREISVLGEQRSYAKTLIEKNEKEIISLKTRLEEISAQKQQARQESSDVKERSEKTNDRLTLAEKTQADTDKLLLKSRAGREEDQRRMLELESKLSSGKAERYGLKQQEDDLAETISGLEKTIADSAPRQNELVKQLDHRRLALNKLLTRKMEISSQQETLSEKIDSLLTEGEECAEEIASVQASLEATEARYKLLEDMMIQYEGHESGVVAAMERKNDWPGIAGTVAELFVPEAGMESALESALGNVARFLVCHDRKTAEDIITYLRSANKGRIGVLVPDIGVLNPAVKRPELSMPGVRGWLDSFVTTDERLRPLLSAILSRTVVFKAETDISELLKHLPVGFSAVSEDGLFYGSHLIFGGSDDRMPLFRRKERLREEQQTLAELKVQILSLKEKRGQITAKTAEARADSNNNDDILGSLEDDLDTARKSTNETEYEQRALTTEIDRVRREKKTSLEKLDGIKGRQYSLSIGHTELTGKQSAAQKDMTDGTNRLEEVEELASKTQSDLARVQVASVEIRAEIDKYHNQLTHLAELTKEINNLLTTKRTEISEATKNISTAGGKITQIEAGLKESFELRERQEERETKLRQVQSEFTARVSEMESSIKTAQKERDEKGDELHQADMRIQSADSEIQMLADRMREEYDIDIRGISPVLPETNPPEGVDNRDYLIGLKEKLKGFGAVNLLALDEFKEASERESFLRVQLEDLTSAKSDLQSTITRINLTARELFNDTFNKVQEHFSDVFVELFTGGEAGISLVDPSDPLESDIEIVARPHGKKLLNITMMSGGERALTAISLLFALYLVKPSPFCILDEIDAPLDDANCNRFLRIIKKFSAQTQFIIITHNKITMEAADNLYGITMQQAGVSRLVAVRFEHDDPNKVAESDEALEEGLPESIRDRISGDVTSVPGSSGD